MPKIKKHNKIICKFADQKLNAWSYAILQPIPKLQCPSQVPYYVPTHTHNTVRRLQDRVSLDVKTRRRQLATYHRIIRRLGKVEQSGGKLADAEKKLLERSILGRDRLLMNINWMKQHASRPKPAAHLLNYGGSSDEVVLLTRCYFKLPVLWRRIVYEKYFVGGLTCDGDLQARLKLKKDVLSKEINQLYTYICGALSVDIAA